MNPITAVATGLGHALATLARGLAAARGRNGRAPPRSPPDVRPRAAGAVPRPLPASSAKTATRAQGSPRGATPRPATRRRSATYRQGRAPHPLLPYVDLGLLPARSLARAGACSSPRCPTPLRRAHSASCPSQKHRHGARDGAGRGRRHRTASACCSRRRMRRCILASRRRTAGRRCVVCWLISTLPIREGERSSWLRREPSASSNQCRDTPSERLGSSSARRPSPRARCAPSRARTRGGRYRVPSARSARRGAPAFPAR